jgi:hypothetical protein
MAVRDASLVTSEVLYSSVNLATDSTTVFSGPCLYFGYSVTTVLSAHACPIQDNATPIDALAASSAVGTSHFIPNGIKCETSLVVDPDNSATGVIAV